MIRLTGDWMKARSTIRSMPRRFKRAVDVSLKQEGQFYRKKILEGFRTGAPGGKKWTPLAKSTLASRKFQGFGGSKIGIVTGAMRNSVKVVKKGHAVFVGIKRSARNKEGKPIIDIVDVFTKGRVIVQRMTPQQRKYLHALRRSMGDTGTGAGSGSTGIIVIRIPARPIFEPILEKYGGQKARARFSRRVAVNMGGAFGRIAGALMK